VSGKDPCDVEHDQKTRPGQSGSGKSFVVEVSAGDVAVRGSISASRDYAESKIDLVSPEDGLTVRCAGTISPAREACRGDPHRSPIPHVGSACGLQPLLEHQLICSTTAVSDLPPSSKNQLPGGTSPNECEKAAPPSLKDLEQVDDPNLERLISPSSISRHENFSPAFQSFSPAHGVMATWPGIYGKEPTESQEDARPTPGLDTAHFGERCALVHTIFDYSQHSDILRNQVRSCVVDAARRGLNFEDVELSHELGEALCQEARRLLDFADKLGYRVDGAGMRFVQGTSVDAQQKISSRFDNRHSYADISQALQMLSSRGVRRY
jgi:hypothetical protein